MPVPDRGYKALRRGRVSLDGQVYLVTTVCHERQPLFADAAAARAAMTVLSAPATWPQTSAQAWVLMPDHWHGLIELRGVETVSRTLQRLKSLVTRAVRQIRSESVPVWQAGFHAHALRCEVPLVAAARYVLDTPVRARLGVHWYDWPWRGGAMLASLSPECPLA